jgi:hypothetical protein
VDAGIGPLTDQDHSSHPLFLLTFRCGTFIKPRILPLAVAGVSGLVAMPPNRHFIKGSNNGKRGYSRRRDRKIRKIAHHPHLRAVRSVLAGWHHRHRRDRDELPQEERRGGDLSGKPFPLADPDLLVRAAVDGGGRPPDDILIGWAVLIANTVWIIYRIAKGWLRLNDNKPMYAA